MIQLAKQSKPKTLMQAIRYFDPDTAERFVAAIKWPHGVVCECGSENVGRINSRRRYQCRDCRKQFSVKVGTIFQDSPLGLDKWLAAIWMIANHRNGVSSCEIARSLGIKQQSAWHLLHRVRHAMKSPNGRKLNGTVEADETYIGGKAEYMNRKRRKRAKATNWRKAIVHAIIERGGEARVQVHQASTSKVLLGHIRENVEPGSFVFTDDHKPYRNLRNEYQHAFVQHFLEYVRGSVHTNGAENYFSVLKRTIKGTYVSIEPEHLERYVDEQSFRFNHRDESDWTRFERLMQRVVGKRLDYRTLTGGKTR